MAISIMAIGKTTKVKLFPIKVLRPTPTAITFKYYSK
jgi:hypothetical protein